MSNIVTKYHSVPKSNFDEPLVDEILPRLYIGDASAALNYDFLKKKGFTHIVNAAKEIPSPFSGEFSYLNLKLDDSLDQNLSSALDRSFSYINGVLTYAAEPRVLVHCAAGISRSSSVIIYYLMRHYGYSFDRALKFIKKYHPQTRPNLSFENQLKSLA